MVFSKVLQAIWVQITWGYYWELKLLLVLSS